LDGAPAGLAGLGMRQQAQAAVDIERVVADAANEGGVAATRHRERRAGRAASTVEIGADALRCGLEEIRQCLAIERQTEMQRECERGPCRGTTAGRERALGERRLVVAFVVRKLVARRTLARCWSATQPPE